jgi:lipopolysaccharide export LptBFGC system permease protein LptF
MNIDEIDELLDEVDELLEDSFLCGPLCKQAIIEEELEQRFIDAKINLENAPIIFEDTKRNYYVFKEGDDFYNEMLESEVEKKANKIANDFNEKVKNVQIMRKYYESDVINTKNSEDLYKQFLKENQHLEKTIKDQYGDILTNNRKTYYSAEALTRLQLWYRIFWYIYYILVIVLILSFLLGTNTNIGKTNKLVITFILLVYPYIIDPIIRWIYYLFEMLYNKLPKNIYNNI